MSFSQDQKADIIGQSAKQSCCKRSLLQGILIARGRLDEDNISVSVDTVETAEFIKNIVLDVYSKKAEEVTSIVGGRRKLLVFSAKSASKLIDETMEKGISFSGKCPACLSYFLRGLFLASGRVSDPTKQYSLEFSVGDRTAVLAEFLSSLDLNPKISVKKNETLIYFRNSTAIEDFFALANMNLKVLLIDVDLGLNNLDVVMGMENHIVYDLIDVLEGKCRLKQALLQDFYNQGNISPNF